MIDLIKQNKFEELEQELSNSENSFDIHKFLFKVIKGRKVTIDRESFKAENIMKNILKV